MYRLSRLLFITAFLLHSHRRLATLDLSCSVSMRSVLSRISDSGGSDECNGGEEVPG